MFKEENSDFYDLEYYISMEYRFLSGAHMSKVKNILNVIGNVQDKNVLDVGCGGGFYLNELKKRGANVFGVDYSRFAISFLKERYPDISAKVVSGYDLSFFDENSFDFVLLIDVIEHMSNQDKVLAEIKRILKPNGFLILATDVDDNMWSNKYFHLINWKILSLSKDGRAYKMIKNVESLRREYKNYHESHINEVGIDDLKNLLERNNYKIIQHKVYPLVGVAIRDVIFKIFLPKKQRGDHQVVKCLNIK